MNSILVLILVVFVSIFALGLSGCSREVSSSPHDPTPVTTSAIKSLSKAEITKMLGRLETQAAPTPKMGAMCYDMAMPPVRAEYVCPLCREKTLYTDNQSMFIRSELDACRREMALIQKSTDLSLSLDESSFCEHCCPDAKEPQLVLEITYSDGSVHQAVLKFHEDLIILNEFLKGDLSYPTFNDGRMPLKERIPRLRELLGVQDDSAE